MREPTCDENQKRSEATLGGLLRLGCCHCDRDDFDGVASFPTDWTNIQAVKQQGLDIWETHLAQAASDTLTTESILPKMVRRLGKKRIQNRLTRIQSIPSLSKLLIGIVMWQLQPRTWSGM